MAWRLRVCQPCAINLKHLKSLDSGSENLEKLRHEAQKARTSYVAAAQLLTEGRVKAAQAIDQAVQAELPP